MSLQMERPSKVSLSQNTVLINGLPVIGLCSSLFYFRIPRALWKDRLEKVKAFGYNCIDVYFPWNYHELSEGVWDFSGERDVEPFLQAAAETGLWVIARPGPYICSEWDGGALPAYLLAKNNLCLRDNDPHFLLHVARWYGRILPVLQKYQLGEGGSIIAVQLENELDFYDCADPAGYISALRDMALEHQIDVPLIACAGQGGLFGASGNASGVVPTCNFYPDDRDPDFEYKVLHYRDELKERGLPLLVTETNRSHFLLRRLLSCGVKLMGAYLQASGTNFGFTNATNNWGRPYAMLTSDYDFGGMISPEGHIRGEAYEGRLLSRLIHCYGSALAKGEAAESHSGNAEQKHPIVRVLGLNRGGHLCFVSNTAEAEVRLAAAHEGSVFPRHNEFTVKPQRNYAFPVKVPLQSWGLPGTIEYAAAELFMVMRFASRTVLLFHAEHYGEICLRFDEPVEVDAGNMWLHDNTAFVTVSFDCRGISSARIRMLDGTLIELIGIERRQALLLEEVDEEKGPVFAETEPDSAGQHEAAISWTASTVEPLGGFSAESVFLGDKADYLEKHGVYRGFAWYRAHVPSLQNRSCRGVLLHQAGDIVSVYSGSHYLSTVVPAGGSRFIPAAPYQIESAFLVRAEIWGHSNFDDAHLPGLRLNAMKGLTGLTAVSNVSDLSQNWHLHRANSNRIQHQFIAPDCNSRSWPLVGWGGWISPDHPSFGYYRRTVCTSEHADSWMLHFPGIGALAEVFVNGRGAGRINPLNPYLDITPYVEPGKPFSLALFLEKAYGQSAGKVLLYEGHAAKDWSLSSCGEQELLQHAAGHHRHAAESDFPIVLQPGQLTWLYGNLSDSNAEKGWRVYCEGSNLKMTVFFNERLIARLWMPGGEERPEFRGGSEESFYLPGPWFAEKGNQLLILLEAVHAGERSELQQLKYVPV